MKYMIMKTAFLLVCFSIHALPQSRDTMSGRLSSAISVSGNNTGKVRITQSAVSEIDINSVISIMFDADKISSLTGSANQGRSAQAAEYSNSIEQLTSLLNRISDFSKKCARVADNPAPDRKEISQMAVSGIAFYEELKAYCKSAPGGDLVSKEYNRLAMGKDGLKQAYSYISDYISGRLKELNKIKPTIGDEASKYMFRVYGVIFTGGSERMINIPGYYSASVDNPTEFGKIRFSLTDEEKKAVESKVNAQQALLDIKNDFVSVQGKFREESDKIIAALKSIKSSAELIIKYDYNKLASFDITPLANKLNASQKKALAVKKIFTDNYKKIEKFVESADSEISNYKKLYEQLSGESRQTAASVMFAILDGLNSAESIIDKLSAGFNALKTPLSNALVILQKYNTADFEGLKKAAIENITDNPECVSFFSELNSLTDNIETFFDLAGGLTLDKISPYLSRISSSGIKSNIISQIAVIKDLSPEQLENLKVLSQDELLDTYINLYDYKTREEGDYIKLRILVTRGTSSVLDNNYFIKIRKFGVSSGVYTGALFANRNKGEYTPTVGVGWMLKYLGGCSGWDSFINSFGIGFHTTTFGVEGNKTHIGAGPAIYLLNNLIQAGFGWDLGENGRPYYYFGVGLVDFINTLTGSNK